MEQMLNSIPKADVLTPASHDHKTIAAGNFVPIRVQRQRTKGWKMPENTVYVGRPTKWGNPFKLLNNGEIHVLDKFAIKGFPKWAYHTHGENDTAVWLYQLLIEGSHFELSSIANEWVEHFSELDFSELKGKNLACFCPLDSPCHADILLKIANGD